MLAPQSRKSSGGPSASGTGIWAASAGRWTPCARFSAKSAAVIVAPVYPALTSELQRPSATAAAAIDDRGIGRGADGCDRLGLVADPVGGRVELDALRCFKRAGPKMRTRNPVGRRQARSLDDDLGAGVRPIAIQGDGSGHVELVLR